MFRQADANSYDEHAAAYARHIGSLAAPLADETVTQAGLSAGDRVLDVGCGTGIATLHAAEVVAQSGRVVGIDLSEGMLQEAGRAVDKSRMRDRIELRRMDAEALELPAGSFDAVISLCAVLHFPDVQRAVAEMRRVLVPGGRLVVSFGTGRPLAPASLVAYAPRRLLRGVRGLLRPQLVAPEHALAIVANELPPAPEPVLTEWGERKPLARLEAAVRNAGFDCLRTSWRGSDVRFTSAEEFWDAQLAIVTELRKPLATAGEAASNSIRERFLRDARDVLERGGELVYPYGAVFVRAVAAG